MKLQKFSLLGSTGSIGTQTLDIVREHHEKFEIVAIAAGRNIDLLAGAIQNQQCSLASLLHLPVSLKGYKHRPLLPPCMAPLMCTHLSLLCGVLCKACVIVFAEQIQEFRPSLVSIQDASQRDSLKQLIKDFDTQPEIVAGEQGILEVASHPDAEAVITGIVGCAGLGPTCAAISKGKDICLANKETLIAGGCSIKQ